MEEWKKISENQINKQEGLAANACLVFFHTSPHTFSGEPIFLILHGIAEFPAIDFRNMEGHTVQNLRNIWIKVFFLEQALNKSTRYSYNSKLIFFIFALCGKTMMALYRYLCTLVAMLCCIAGVNAADKAGKDVTDTLSAESRLMRYAGNIHQFNQVFPQEKVYIQFDNTSYYQGETIWFKAFVVEASTHHRAPSGVLYVDLLAPNGELLKQQKLKIVAGQADGSFPLIDGSTAYARDLRGTVLPYPSGFYEVRAYTSNMLNFSEAGVFSRVFPVFEKPEKDGNYFGESPVIKVKKVEVDDPTDFREKTPRLSKLNAEFYPEGGSLVCGLPCRVAFRLTGGDGLPVYAEGSIDNLPLRVEHDGMGSFIFTPTSRNNSAEFILDGRRYSFSLPLADESGYSLCADATQNNSLTVAVRSTVDMPVDTLGLTLTCRGELAHFSTIVPDGGEYVAEIPMDGVPEGVCQLTLFDRNGAVFARRHTYHRNESLRAPALSLSSDSDAIGPFQRVHLDFELADGNGAPFRDRFCLSVRDSRLIGTAASADDLRTSLLLSSDLRGLVLNPEYYFESNDAEHQRALDLLMMVQGWERYDWRTMTGVEPYTEVHRLEKGLTLNGWVEASWFRKKMSGIDVYATVMPQDREKTELFEYFTDTTGYFGFNLSDFYGYARVSLKTNMSGRLSIVTPLRFHMERSMTPGIRCYQPEETVFSYLKRPAVQSVRKRSDIVLQQESISQDESDVSMPVVIQDAGIMLPDVEIKEKRKYIDYFTFKAYNAKEDTERDMDSGDYSTDVEGYLMKRIVVYPNAYSNFIYVHDSKRCYADNPVYGGGLNVDMMDVRSITVYDRPVYFADAIELCPLYKKYYTAHVNPLEAETTLENRVRIIDIELKDEHERTRRKDRFNLGERITNIPGFSAPYRFYSPEYPEGPIIGDVDYRRTLYWNPNVVTDAAGHAEVEFYNNSYSRHLSVSAAGITAGGTPYVLDAEF